MVVDWFSTGRGSAYFDGGPFSGTTVSYFQVRMLQLRYNILQFIGGVDKDFGISANGAKAWSTCWSAVYWIFAIFVHVILRIHHFVEGIYGVLAGYGGKIADYGGTLASSCTKFVSMLSVELINMILASSCTKYFGKIWGLYGNPIYEYLNFLFFSY